MMWIRLHGLAVLSLTILIAGLAFAGTSGKISGTVTDKGTGLAIPGARVQLSGTTMGAMVNPVDGSYVILNVVPGKYTIIASCIGYNKSTVVDLLVNSDVTTEQNLKLTSEAINMDSVVVIAKAPTIDKFEVGTVSRISAEAMKAIPVIDISGVIKAQTGFVSQGGSIHVRGSRAGGMGIVDDGVMIKDQLGGYGSTNLGGSDATPINRLSISFSPEDVEDMSIMKGNYSAEYGNVSGGIVTTQRKEGSNKITNLGVTYITDDLGSHSLNKYSFNKDRIDLNLSGPLPLIAKDLFPALGLKWPGENMSYYSSFYMDKYDSYSDYNNYNSPNSKIDYGHTDFLGIDIPDRRVNTYSGFGKITWKMDANSRYKLNLRYSKDWDKARDFNFNFLYDPKNATVLKSSREIASASFSFTPPFVKDTYGEVQFSQVTQTYERTPGGLKPNNFYVPTETGWEDYTDSNHNGRWDTAEPYTDLNRNGQWDPGEPFQDTNGNGSWDDAEDIYNDLHYVDTNHNGIYDDVDSVYVFVDSTGRRHGDGVYNPQLSYQYNVDNPEPYVDGDSSLGEPYTDINGNGVYNQGIDIWSASNDYDHNGRYTGPRDTWASGIPYLDRNQNGHYDAPNSRYDYGEVFTDVNGNGRWDNTDKFWDSGFDQWAQYHHDYSRTRTLKFDITSQVSRHHGLKSGFEFNTYKINYQDMQYPYSPYNGPSDNGPWANITRVIEKRDNNHDGLPDSLVYQTYSRGTFRDFYTRTPKDGALYIKDRLEYGEMIADIGIRYEFIIQAREVKDSVTLATEGNDMLIIDSHQKFAPRVGFAFPISDKAKMMFNYGHFYQKAGFTSYYERATQSSRAFSVIGNPNLDYEKTILYEIGVQYAISDGYRLDVSGYYKDQYGLINTVSIGLSRGSSEVQSNVDYARARGMEFEFEKKYGQFLSGSIKYEYTYAFGKSSSDRSDYYIRFNGGQISIKENPLDWDIRHNVTLSASLNVTKGEHPRFGIIRLPDDWDANILWQYKTGRPFTPAAGYPGLYLRRNESPQTNSKRMPATSSVDISVDKNFQIYGINYALKLLVNNVFDTHNVDYVYTNTGLAYSNINTNGQIKTGVANDLDPTNYTSGRQIMVGLGIQF